jgi:diguanylate cyclase (GGDEF)-like protein
MRADPASKPPAALPWIYRARTPTVVAAVTCGSALLSTGVCYLAYVLLGMTFSLGDSGGLVMALAPPLAPLLLAPLTLVPIVRAGRRMALLLDEVQVLQGELEDQARHDALTGALNRRGFFSAAAERRDRVGVVLTVDVNELKPVNDTWGHASGDDVLCAVADALRTAAGPGALVARMGGDEFVTLLDGADRGRSDAIRERLENLSVTLPDGSPAAVSASLGVAPVQGRDGIDAALVAADRLMYAAKRRSAQRRAA